MNSRRFYDNFSEIEDEVRLNAPEIIYKYRDWDDGNHKSILSENVIWFSHPKDLNDPYDIRVPVRFDKTEVNNPIFFEKLKFNAKRHFPFLSQDSREFRILCERKLDEIKEDPEKYFQDRFLEMRESDVYDGVGLFSLSSDPLDQTMWAHYSNNSRGFSVGFKTLKLVEELNSLFGKVKYDDIPPLYSFLKDIEDNEEDVTLLKHTKWINESEWRFLTFGIQSNKGRAKVINKNSVAEVIVGEKISQKNLEEITDVLKLRYNGKVKLYQIELGPNYGLLKKELHY